MQVIKLADLDSYVDKQPITAVEGTLTDLFQPTLNKKDGTPLPYPKQNGKLTQDGKTWAVAFAEPVFQDKSMKGRTIRISSVVGSHGMNGLKMDLFNPQYPKINVTGSAKIEILGAAEASPPQQATPSQPTRSNAPQANSVQSRAMPEPGVAPDSPAEDRIRDYFQRFRLVKMQADLLSAESKGAVTLPISEVKDIATHISMTYRGQYGSYRPPLFSPKTTPKPVPQTKSEQAWEAVEDDVDSMPF